MNRTQDILLNIVYVLTILLGVQIVAVAIAPWSHGPKTLSSEPAVEVPVETEYYEVRTIIKVETTICDGVCLEEYAYDYSVYLEE